MIPALGAGGPGFDPRPGPHTFFFLFPENPMPGQIFFCFHKVPKATNIKKRKREGRTKEGGKSCVGPEGIEPSS